VSFSEREVQLCAQEYLNDVMILSVCRANGSTGGGSREFIAVKLLLSSAGEGKGERKQSNVQLGGEMSVVCGLTEFSAGVCEESSEPKISSSKKWYPLTDESKEEM